MKIALAQSKSFRGDVNANIKHHSRFIEKASSSGVQLIAFPELSLTGYEPDLATKEKFIPNDSRLIPLLELAATHQMIIVAGAPIALESGLHIGEFILYPNQKISVYTKHHLHDGEEKYFIPGNQNPRITLGTEIISLAICADINHQVHAANAAKSGATVYLSSVFITEKGYKVETGQLQKYALDYRMTVFMANTCGSSSTHVSAGKSICWNRNGKFISSTDSTREGLLIASKTDQGWDSKHVYF